MQEDLLAFVRKILLDARIKSYLVPTPYQWDEQFDAGLRKAIFQNTDSQKADLKDFFTSYMQTFVSSNTIKSISDEYHCEYLCLKLPDESQQSILLIGPFTYEVLNVARISQLCNDAQIPANLLNFMQQYYASIPYVADEKWIRSLLKRLAEAFWGPLDDLGIDHFRMRPDSSVEVSYRTEIPEPSIETIANLEFRYRNEERMMEMISNGDYASIEKMVEDYELPKPIQRFDDSLRDTKNGLIILNTLCRKAAQRGHVHPVYLDDVSKKFALKIEYCNSMQQLDQYQKEMMRKYCMLVQSHSLRDYSKPIREVINQITLHLNSDLSLEALADFVALNKSYLSTLFKKETGETLTTFVNKKRIEHAIYLLNSSKMSIQDIASICGIPDVNYFTKTFKKLKTITPSEYRKMIRNTEQP